MSTTIFDARIKFAPKVSTSDDGRPYVQLTVSTYVGKNANGDSHFNEYHLFVWNKYDIELAKMLGVGDRIVATIEREKNNFRIDPNTGNVYPYTSGNVRTGEICAVFSVRPSEGLIQYETAQQQRRDWLKQQAQTPATAPSTAPVAMTTTPVTAPATAASTPVVTAPVATAPVTAPATAASTPVVTAPVATAPVVNAQVQTTAQQTQPPTYHPNQAQATAQPNATQNLGGAVLPEGYEVPF